MEFRTEIVLTMPKKSQKTFDALLRAWNKIHVTDLKFKPLAPLKEKDRRKIKFDGPKLKELKSLTKFRKSLALFTRAYNVYATQYEKPSAPKSTTTRKSRAKKSSGVAKVTEE